MRALTAAAQSLRIIRRIGDHPCLAHLPEYRYFKRCPDLAEMERQEGQRNIVAKRMGEPARGDAPHQPALLIDAFMHQGTGALRFDRKRGQALSDSLFLLASQGIAADEFTFFQADKALEAAFPS